MATSTPDHQLNKTLFRNAGRRLRDLWNAAHKSLREKARREWAAKNQQSR